MSFLFGVLVGIIGTVIFLVVKNVVTPKEIVDSVDSSGDAGA